MLPKFSLDQTEVLQTRRLTTACDFLCRHEVSGRGWPQYPGGMVTLYHTALVVTALSAADHHAFVSRINSAVGSLVSLKKVHVHELKLTQLADLLKACLAALDVIEEEEVDNIRAELIARIEKEMAVTDRFRVRECADAVATVLRTSARIGHTEQGNQFAITKGKWIQRLLSAENVQEGGWPGSPGGRVSVLTTATVVEALHVAGQDADLPAMQRGLRLLNAKTADGGWHNLGIGSDVFVQATVLRTLASLGPCDNVDAGIACLDVACNEAGGWGVHPGTPSAIEPTAAAIQALVASGENRVLPYRTAVKKITEAATRVAELEAALAKAEQKQEEGTTKKEKRQREVLETKVKALESELERIQGELGALEEVRTTRMMLSYFLKTSDIGYNRSWRDLTEYALPVFLVTLGLQFWLFYPFIARVTGFDPLKLYIAVVSIVAAINLVWTGVRSRQKRIDALKRYQRMAKFVQHDNRVSSIVLAFADLASRMPSMVREELSYLTERVAEMPPNIGREYARDSIRKFKLPADLEENISSWLLKFLSLDLYARRAVNEQIHRQSHAA